MSAMLKDPPLFPATHAKAPLQVARWSGKRAAFPFGDPSANHLIPDNASLIEISATENCYIAFGDTNSIAATAVVGDDGSRLFLAGVQVVSVPISPATGLPYAWIAALQYTIAGLLQVEKLS